MNEKMKNINEVNEEKCDCGHECGGCGDTCKCGGSCHDEHCMNESVDLSNKIEFNLSNGSTYYVEPENIDWEELLTHVDDIKDNALTMRQMMINLMTAPNDEELINTIYNSLSEFLKDFNIDLDYSSLLAVNPDLSKREICIIAVYDTTNIIDTFLNHIEINNIITSLMNIAGDGSNENPFTSEEFEKHIEEMSKMFNMVEGAMDNNDSIPSPEELEKQMKAVAEKYKYDAECGHAYMDGLMCEVLEKLGYSEAVKIFDEFDKYYA